MKKLAAILLFIPFTAFGIQPVIFSLTEAAPNYTVPEGKVLLIETLSSGGASGVCNLSIAVGGSTHPCRFSIPESSHVTFARPVKIPSEAVLTVTQFFSGETYTFFCLLATEADLYANVDSKVNNFLVENGEFSFDVEAASRRPAKLSLEGSTDLLAWFYSDASVTKAATNLYSVSIPVGDQEKFFARYSLKSVGP